MAGTGVPCPAVTSHQHCHHHSGAGLGQGHPECLICPSPTRAILTMPNREHCSAALGTVTGLSQGQGDSPVRATHFPPVPYPLVAGALRMPGHGGTGIPGHWGSLVPASWLPWTHWIWGSLGVQGHRAFVVTRVARGPMGAGDMREIPTPGSTPIPVCIHTRGAEGPGGPEIGRAHV